MNDAASRAGRESGAVPPFRRAPYEVGEEELETGEPLEDAAESVPVKKIRARSTPFRGDSGRREREEPECRSEGEGARCETGGQMVLATAKYMPAQPPEPDRRGGQGRGRRVPQPEAAPSTFEGRVFHSGKWGGMLAMAVAVIWFLAGLANDTFFIYPPILFVIGLAAFMKDTTRGD